MAKSSSSKGRTRREAKKSKTLGDSEAIDIENFDSDLPITPDHKKDRLGFRSVARELASSLRTQSTKHGLVVSVEGEWGSGKSSLVNFLIEDLLAQSHAPEIVRFEPWLVGSRDGMLNELMSDLASAVEKIEASEKEKGKKLKESALKLAEQLRDFAYKLSRRATPVAQLAELFGVPLAGWASKGLRLIRVLVGAKAAKPLTHVKEALTNGLIALPRKILVIIDDLDRLEPNEALKLCG